MFEPDAGVVHGRHSGIARSFQVDGSAGVGHDDCLKAVSGCVQRRELDAEIEGQSGDVDPCETTLAHETVQSGRSCAVIFIESGVGIDRKIIPLAHDQHGTGHVEASVELGALSRLDTMIWPQGLLAIGHLDRLEGLVPHMGRGKRAVPLGVPVLRQDLMLELAGEAVDHGDDGVAIRHGQRTARAEIVLDVNGDKKIVVLIDAGHGSHVVWRCRF